MTVLLKDALKPNLVQTGEGQPALVHCGPFANIAHGNNSLVSDRLGLKLSDYVVTESGFGADMGFEKFVDIVCRLGGIAPSAVVLVATVQALKHHGGDPNGGVAALERGMDNLRANLRIVNEFGLPCVVAVNRFPGDARAEIDAAIRLARELDITGAAISDGFEQGGAGSEELAEAVLEAAVAPVAGRYLYELEDPIEQKIEAIATRAYGAGGVELSPVARRQSRLFAEAGLGHLPICMAKTHLSLSHDSSAARSADRIHIARAGASRLHGRRVDRRSLRRHADDARAADGRRGSSDRRRCGRRHRRSSLRTRHPAVGCRRGGGGSRCSRS